MANSDYQVRGSADITPSGDLRTTMNPGTLVIAMANYTATDDTLPAAGMGLMIGGEIMRVVSVDLPLITVARGCADTIPMSHAFGSKIWCITGTIGSDTREYIATETIGVKVLMRSLGGQVPMKSAPPNALQFNSRFARPYPPGFMRVNGKPWWAQRNLLDAKNRVLSLSWTHRDRVTQDDTLQGHEIGSIGPELGVSYVLQVYRSSDNQLLATREIEGSLTYFDYTMTMARADLQITTAVGVVEGYFKLFAQREGFLSWMGYRIDFIGDVNDIQGGWGNSFGAAFGN